MFVLNTYSFHRKKYIEKNPTAKYLPRKFHQNFQSDLTTGLLKKKKSVTHVQLRHEKSDEVPKKKNLLCFLPETKNQSDQYL